MIRVPLSITVNEVDGQVRLVFADKGYIVMDRTSYQKPLGEVVKSALRTYQAKVEEIVDDYRELGEPMR